MDVISIKDFRERLDPKLLKKIKELEKKKEISYYKKAKKLEQERLNSLHELERSKDE